MSRGRLRIYLGAAPGVGKTFAMLGEGRRRAERGTDVVVGYVETHGRPRTAEQIGDLEVVPRQRVTYRGTTLEEMDLDAVLERRPTVALVDELAHTNAPGVRHEKRWQDVAELLDAGIDVISTVNVQHLESLNDVVETITGVRQRETVPDHVVRSADQVELVDMSPEALRRRLAHGNVYAAEKVDAALTNYFRPGNLNALRELALLWVADKVDEALQKYLRDEQIPGTWETRERVVVAVTGAASGEHLIRRAARMARRSHGELVGVHVQGTSGLAEGPGDRLIRHRRLLSDLGGSYHETTSEDVAEGLVAFARSVRATQLVLGATRRSRWSELVRGSVINRVIRESGDIDVHVISDERDEQAALPEVPHPRRSPLSARRRLAGWAVVVLGLPLLTAVLVDARETIGLPSALVTYLVVVCVVASIGGMGPALLAAAATSVAANWFFTEPYSTLRIEDPEQVIAVVALVAAGVLVSLLVGQSARRNAAAARARAEAEAIVSIATSPGIGGSDSVAVVLAHLRITFDQVGASVFAVGDDGPTLLMSDGPAPPRLPEDGERIDLGGGLTLCLSPGVRGADDRRVLGAFAARLGESLERRDLREAADEAVARARADELRTAILRAVSHDLRSPLASIKASATSLLQDDVDWSVDQRLEFARTIDEEADRLDRLVANLLDMSRIEAGVVQSSSRPLAVDEVVGSALGSLSVPTDRVRVELAEDLPDVVADSALLERVLANIISNALEHAPSDTPVAVHAAQVADEVVVRVIDRGPGVAHDLQAQMFDPFQRLGDHSGGGVGLGLAVASGFMAAMGGAVVVTDTPGGGLTAVLTLPVAAGRGPSLRWSNDGAANGDDVEGVEA